MESSVHFFTFTTKCRKTQLIPDNRARLHYVTKNNSTVKYPSYSLTLNSKISNEITRNGLRYVRCGENTLTGELFLQFIQEKSPNTLNLSVSRNKNPEKSVVTIYNKQLVLFLMERFGIKEENAATVDLNVSDNKSHTNGIVVLLISYV